MATFEELMAALRKADAAGDTEGAARIAQMASKVKGVQPNPQAASAVPQDAPSPALPQDPVTPGGFDQQIIGLMQPAGGQQVSAVSAPAPAPRVAPIMAGPIKTAMTPRVAMPVEDQSVASAAPVAGTPKENNSAPDVAAPPQKDSGVPTGNAKPEAKFESVDDFLKKGTISGYVNRVFDGDTFEISGKKVRLAALDCPEGNRFGGAKATALVTELTKDVIVTCELDGTTTYDRLVGYCAADGRDIGQAMIDGQVCGVWEKFDSKGRYLGSYQGAEMRDDNGKGVVPAGLISQRPVDPANFVPTNTKKFSASLAPGPVQGVEDPLLAALRGEDVQANGAPMTYGASRDANDQRPPSDPFEGEGFKPLVKRRGQQFVRGATEVVASVPESVAITGEMADRSRSAGAVQGADFRAQLIADIDARLADPATPANERAILERNKADMNQGIDTLRVEAAQPIVPAQNRPVFAAGDQIRGAVTDTVGAPDPRDVGFWAQAAEGSGNMAGMIAASTAGGLVGGPAGSLAVGGMTGATMNQSQVFKEALDAGADQETALQASKWAAVIGAGEIIPINRALKILPPRLRGELATGFMRKFVDLAQASGEEAAQEYLSQVANNIAAQKLYDPERGWTEGATDAALVGAVLGAGVGGVGLALEGKPAAQDVTAPPRREEPPADPLSQITAAMQPPAPDQAPKAPAPEQPAPQAATNQTQPQPSQGDAGRYEILDEIENGPDGQRVPTGRKVRYDRQTGTVEPIGPDQTDAEVKPEAQPTAEMRKSADAEPAPEAQPSPTADPAPQADVVQAAGGTVPPAPIPNQPRNFEFIDAAGVAKIGTEPGVMQYKAGGDAEGVTDRLKGVTEWRPERAGMSIIYEYAGGRRVIADGHQRLGLAKRLAKRLAGQGKAIQMPAMILRQADGVTPEDARVTAALKNIAEGSGTALDAAKVLRSTDKTPDQLGLPPSSAIVRDAMGMRNLSDQAFGMVINGVSSERDGGIVGRAVTDKAAQANILALLARMQKERPITAFQAESVARQAAADTVVETQDSLFGPEDDTKNLYLERAKILEAASKMKREEQSAFRNVIANADRLAAAGNQLDAYGNQTRLDSAAAMRDYLGREANTKGAISEALTAAARALNGGATVAAATRQFLDAVERELGARGSERQGGDQRGQAAGSNRPQESGDQGLASAGQDEAATDGDLFAPAQTGKTPDQVRAEAEAAVRAQQSKLRKPGGNSGDAGPLFNPDQDLFDPPKAKQSDGNSGASFLATGAALRAELKAAVTEEAPLRKSTDLTEKGPGVDLERRLAAATSSEERQKVAADFTLERGRQTGNEHLVFLGPDGALISLTEGDPKGVEFPDAAHQAVVTGKASFSVHNHPGNRGPSSADIGNLFGGVDPMVIVGHDGARHEMRRSEAAKILKPADAIRAYKALEARLAQLWRRDQGGVSPDALVQQFHNVIVVTMERLGLIEYDGTAATDIKANGIETDDLSPPLFSAVAPGLRRSGYSVPESGDRGGNRRAGADATQPGTESAPRNPSGLPEGGNGRGRVPAQGLKPAPKADKLSSGNAAIDGALDDIFGDEADVPSPGQRVERDSGNPDPADGMGGTGVPAAAGRDGRGGEGRTGPGGSPDGEQGAGGGLPGGDAPPVGSGSDPGMDRTERPARKPAAGRKRGAGDGNRAGGLSPDTGRGADPAGDASGASTGKLTPAQQLAAIRGIFKEDVIDFVAGPPRRRTDSDAFRKWFGDSQVVDKAGRPLVVYHGTNENFEVFDPARLGDSTGADSAKMGFFFAKSADVAASYAVTASPYRGGILDIWNKITGGLYERINEAAIRGLNRIGVLDRASAYPTGGNVIPAYLSVQNPMIADFKGAEYREESFASIIARAKASGHDGVILRDTVDEGFEVGGDGVTDVFVAFDPTQIKSIFNQGTWDASSPYMLREDAANPIDPRKSEALESIFVAALDGVDVAKASDRDLFRAIILPLRDAGMTREEVVELTPYLESFLADLRAGRVGLAPEPAPRAIEADDRAAVQAKADRIKPVAADEANIRATLPLLLPEQQDDVLKVERRFAKPDGHGMMITNGAVPGFQFKTEADRQAFLDDMAKPTVGFAEDEFGFEPGGDGAFAAQFMQELAQVDDLFQNPRSAGTTLKTVFADIDPSITIGGRLAKDDPRAEDKDADEVFFGQTAKGKPFYVMQTGKEVWIDVSDLSQGDGGNAIYSAISDYALNTGKVFVGDPAGLSFKALRRRTDNMLSTALKHGTTRHIEPHPDQVAGHPDHGIPGLRWTEGDDAGNLASLIEVSVANLTSLVPEVADARYDFQTGTFRTGEGQPLSDVALDGWVSAAGRSGAARIGRRTLKRGILLNTLAQSESGERPGILARSLRQSRQLVTRGGLRRTFYQASHPIVKDADAATDRIAAMMPKLRAELDRLDLKRVKLAMDSGSDWQGMFQVTGDGAMEIIIAASLDPMKTLHHEVIHALRSLDLFTPSEWRALELAAERGWIEKHDIAARYPDLLPHEQIEEAIAEEFSEALAARKSPKGSALVTAFNKIARLLRALRNVLNGAGYQTAEDVFGRVLAGEISKRQAGNTGVRAAMGQRKQQLRIPSRQTRAHLATAMGGQSAFIPDRRLWEELTDASKPIWEKISGAGGAVSDKIDRVRFAIQDRFLPILRAQEAVMRATGKPLTPDQNAYLAETTFSGKVGRHLFEIDEEVVRPIIDMIAETNGDLTVDQVGRWLYARHAEERNKQIAAINDQMPDGGSGMTNAEAQKVLRESAAGPHAKRLAKIGDLIDGLREKTIAMRLDSGLITESEADVWRKAYASYVPLQGFAETDHSEASLDANGIGRRFNIRGDETKRALGRKSEAFNPLQAAITQAQEVSIRAEKNRVANAVFELAKDYPSKALWEVKPVVEKRYFNKTTGMVETRAEHPISMLLQPNEMAVKVAGKEHRIILRDERLAEAIGNMGADQLQGVVKVLGPFSRFFSAVNTSLSPAFVIKNAVRDFTSAQINMAALKESKAAGFTLSPKQRAAIMAGMARDWRKAFMGVMRGQRYKFDTEWGKHFEEFQKSGAQVWFWRMEDPKAAKGGMEKRVRLATGGASVRAAKNLTTPSAFFSSEHNVVLGAVERVNMAVDNAIRLAAFVSARKQGLSAEQAAFLSKELTTNFNRRGKYGAALNAVFPFFNAAVQGSTRLLQALSNWKMAVGLTLGGAGLGMILDLVNAALSDDDDDGEKLYDKIPDYRNRTNQHIVSGDGSTAWAIPLPYGYNIFMYGGQQLGKVMRGVKDEGDAFADLAAATAQSYMPTDSLIPGILQPYFEIRDNENFFGSAIYPEKWGQEQFLPDAANFFPSASEASKWLAMAMNKASGGSELKSGLIDISPETIDHYMAFVVGGAGRFWGNSIDNLAKVLQGKTDEIETKDIPFVGVVRSEVSPWIDKDRFRRFGLEVEDAEADMKAVSAMSLAPSAGYPGAAAGRFAMFDEMVGAEKRPLLALIEPWKRANREINGTGEFNPSNTRGGKYKFVRPSRPERDVMLEFNALFLKAAGRQAE